VEHVNDLPAPDPIAVIGGLKPKPEAAIVAEKQARPVFPDAAWEGTVFGQFAEIVCRGTFMRKRLASESFRAIKWGNCRRPSDVRHRGHADARISRHQCQPAVRQKLRIGLCSPSI